MARWIDRYPSANDDGEADTTGAYLRSMANAMTGSMSPDSTRAGVGPAAPPDTSTGDEYAAQDWRDIQQGAVQAIPMLLSTGGAVLGARTGPAAPLAVPVLSGLGGMAGKMIEGKLRPSVGLEPFKDPASEVGKEFAWDAALAGAGPIARKLVGAGGKLLYRTGLRMPPTKFADRGAEAVEWGARNRITTVPKAERGLATTVAQREALLKETKAAGHRVSIREAAQDAIRQADEVAREGGKALTAKERNKIGMEFYKEAYDLLRLRARGAHPRLPKPGKKLTALKAAEVKLSPKQAQMITQTAQNTPAVQAMYAKRLRGSAISRARPEMAQDVGAGVRKALGNIPEFGPRILSSQDQVRNAKKVLEALRVHHTNAPTLVQLGAGGLASAAAGTAGAGFIPRMGEALLAAGAVSPLNLRRLGSHLYASPWVRHPLTYGPMVGAQGAEWMFRDRTPSTEFESPPPPGAGRWIDKYPTEK